MRNVTTKKQTIGNAVTLLIVVTVAAFGAILFGSAGAASASGYGGCYGSCGLPYTYNYNPVVYSTISLTYPSYIGIGSYQPVSNIGYDYGYAFSQPSYSYGYGYPSQQYAGHGYGYYGYGYPYQYGNYGYYYPQSYGGNYNQSTNYSQSYSQSYQYEQQYQQQYQTSTSYGQNPWW